MANKTEIPVPEILVTTYVTGSSRYTSSKVVYYSANKIITLTTYKKRIFPTSEQDRFTTLTPRHTYRPDLAAFDLYNASSLWWVLMEANGIPDVFDFVAGKDIRVPSVF